MSYEIVRSIKINKDLEVMITSASSNVTPKVFEKWHCESLSKIAKERGKAECISEILYQYWSGEFQNSNNLFDKSVQYFELIHPEYTWSNVGAGKLYSKESVMLLLLDNYYVYKNRNKNNNKKFILYDTYCDCYLSKLVKNGSYFVYDSVDAQIFNNMIDVKIAISKLSHRCLEVRDANVKN